MTKDGGPSYLTQGLNLDTQGLVSSVELHYLSFSWDGTLFSQGPRGDRVNSDLGDSDSKM